MGPRAGRRAGLPARGDAACVRRASPGPCRWPVRSSRRRAASRAARCGIGSPSAHGRSPMDRPPGGVAGRDLRSRRTGRGGRRPGHGMARSWPTVRHGRGRARDGAVRSRRRRRTGGPSRPGAVVGEDRRDGRAPDARPMAERGARTVPVGWSGRGRVRVPDVGSCRAGDAPTRAAGSGRIGAGRAPVARPGGGATAVARPRPRLRAGGVAGCRARGRRWATRPGRPAGPGGRDRATGGPARPAMRQPSPRRKAARSGAWWWTWAPGARAGATWTVVMPRAWGTRRLRGVSSNIAARAGSRPSRANTAS